MRSILLVCFFATISTKLPGQVPLQASKSVSETQTSILTSDPSGISLGRPISNFRLFLKYSAPKAFQLKLGAHPIDLPAGDDTTVDLSFEHIPGAPGTVHLQRSGDLEPQRIEIPNSNTISDGSVLFNPLPGKDFPMNESFTLMVRFSTTSKNGTLAAKAPPTGKWQPKGKTLFLRGGRLHYDIGWVGEIHGGKDLADGQEHVAVLTVDKEGQAELFVDGISVVQKRAFTSEDNPNHVFKIGSTSPDFAGDFKKGSIEQVMYWKRGLGGDEVKALGKGNNLAVNTPDFHWRPDTQKKSLEKEPILTTYGAIPGVPTNISLENAEGVTFSEAWIQALEKSDHRNIVAKWDDAAFTRGETIYNQLCITCHGSPTKEGSIPLALKFYDPAAEFKNGSDPFRMWQTMHLGYGLMMPMPQYSTKQKYDVVHYIREEFLAKSNPKFLTKIDDAYLAALPRGMTVIEEVESANQTPQYELMDFGNVLFHTYQIEPGPIDQEVNIAQKGIAIRLNPGPGGVSKGNAWAVYDHDTMRLAAFYTGDGFVDWKGIDFDGSHGTHTSIVGKRIITTPDRPGWLNPESSDTPATRIVGKDGRKFGPIPREWAQYRGLHMTEQGPVLEYLVGGNRVLERPSLDGNGQLVRSIQMDSTDHKYKVLPEKPEPKWTKLEPLKYPESKLAAVTTEINRGSDADAFAVDVLTVPDAFSNPYNSWMRTSGFDFYPDGKRAAICTWMGDVWIVEGVDQAEGRLTWKRICAGLFQPLGLKIVDGSIFVICRDQLAKLHDKNGDETIDFIECYNNDHHVTEHFHEFAMGLQTDSAGNFYYAKSARHAKDSLVPHHGTLLRISADGSRTDILATGFRAANGVCINPDGTFIVTDQEGHWNPKNRINWVNGDGPKEFFGNIYGYSPVTDQEDSAMKNPVCWITNAFDRSPAELVWVPKEARWGALNGQLLNLSYGYGKVYVVPHEEVNGQKQGGMCALPSGQFPTGVMRGRFHPQDGQLYTCGMFAWAGSQQQAGGFYRLRKTEKPAYLPIKLEAKNSGISIALTDQVNPESVIPQNFVVKTWDLKRSAKYGSNHYNEKSLEVSSAKVSEDGKTIFLELPGLKPTWGMSIEMKLRGASGDEFERLIHNSIFELGK